MKTTFSFSLFLCLYAFNEQQVVAHSHTYIVEQPTAVVVVQPQIPTATVVVESPPPAEIYEEMGQSPGANFTWIGGNWHWNGYRWERIHGHWIEKPRSAAIWVPGCWREHDHHWRWTEGYWQ
jgi:hypothetical protein